MEPSVCALRTISLVFAGDKADVMRSHSGDACNTGGSRLSRGCACRPCRTHFHREAWPDGLVCEARDVIDDSRPASSELVRDLEPVQIDLLEEIWQPVARSASQWPVWDYVARTLFRREPPVTSPGSLLRSLPEVPAGIQRSPYGLVWREGYGTIEPLLDSRVGLTIAGLHALRQRSVEAGVLADEVSRYIGIMAGWERNLVPDTWNAVESKVQLVEHTQRLMAELGDGLNQITTQNVHDVLRHEFAPLNLLPSGSGDDLLLTLRMHLVQFYGVRTADEYLTRVADQLPAAAHSTVNPPNVLPQLLDYLSLVLARDEQWRVGDLVAAPDLRSAGSLFRSVSTDVEFRDAMSGLASVLERLRTPPMPDEVLDAEFGGQKPSSLLRLKYWLTVRLRSNESVGEVAGAVDVLRDAVRLRVEGAHSNPDVRRRAVAARQRLGLPEIVFDWGAAWDQVRAKCADAVDLIAREVRAVQAPEDL